METDKQGMQVTMRGKGEHKGWTIWIHKLNFGEGLGVGGVKVKYHVERRGEVSCVQVKFSNHVPTLTDGFIPCPLLTPSTPSPPLVCNIWWRSTLHSPQYKLHPSLHTYRELEYYRVIETPIHTQLNPVYNASPNISDRFLE